MYGSGIYFAESSTKADEYSKKLEEGGPDDDTFAILVCRVLMGQYHYTQHKDIDAEGYARSGLSDSTLGDRLSSVGTYREFVVYSSAQVYPQYLLIYQRVHFRDSPAQVEQRQGCSQPSLREFQRAPGRARRKARRTRGP